MARRLPPGESLAGAAPEFLADAGPGTWRGRVAAALGLALGPVAALGLARFAYSLLLPAMRSNLHWSFATAGAMNTANAVGYLGGALVAGPLARRLGARKLFLAGMACTFVALLATAASGNVAALLLLRFAAGAVGAGVLVAGASLVARLGAGDTSGRAAMLLGIYFAGGGLGIIVSGLAVPSLLAAAGRAGWRWGWVLLGGLAVIASAASVPAVLATPEPLRLPPGGRRWPIRTLSWILVAYCFFGAGYIAYITFIIAFLKAKGGAGTAEITAFWVIIGVAVIAAGFAWGPVLARFRGGKGAATVLAFVAAGALVPLLSASPPAAYVSAVVFGGSFLSLVTAVVATVRRFLHPQYWTSAIATLTVAFAIGQCAGPVLAGVLSDTSSGLRAGLILSVVLLGVGSLVALAQPDPEPHLGSER